MIMYVVISRNLWNTDRNHVSHIIIHISHSKHKSLETYDSREVFNYSSNNARPTLTIVLPSATAIGKSCVIPIDSSVN